jgi:uncharacterized damage-inducible protein DinB
MTDPRYPVGRFEAPLAPLSAAERESLISEIDKTPAQLRAALAGLTDDQLDTPYRDGGWTARQVAHHIPDSHMNAYVRFRLAVTEDLPTIRPYMEDRWAELADSRLAPIEVSLPLLEALHRRWALFLRALTPEQWQRRFRHPDIGTMSLDQTLSLYAWHGRHHVAHVASLRERMGWR